MSRFFSETHQALRPYTPGEQPRDMKYIKLNTNESPFPPTPRALEMARAAAERENLYSDPACTDLRAALAERYSVLPENVICTNGSDEVLYFAFMAFCDEKTGAAFPDITYGFYSVFADLCRIPYVKIPLEEDFTVDIKKYFGIGKTVLLANPNAPTGIALSPSAIEEVLQNNPDNVVVVDEAYVDFGAESAIPLTEQYENLLVTGTFSKSRSMAGARLGFGIASRALIADLEALRYSTNPYNVNSVTMAMGVGTLKDDALIRERCATVADVREQTAEKLRAMGFVLTESKANFLFAKHPALDGGEVYRALRERGILVRHFDAPRIKDYNRITVGDSAQMQALVSALSEILAQKGYV